MYAHAGRAQQELAGIRVPELDTPGPDGMRGQELAGTADGGGQAAALVVGDAAYLLGRRDVPQDHGSRISNHQGSAVWVPGHLAVSIQPGLRNQFCKDFALVQVENMDLVAFGVTPVANRECQLMPPGMHGPQRLGHLTSRPLAHVKVVQLLPRRHIVNANDAGFPIEGDQELLIRRGDGPWISREARRLLAE